ncbi:MAG: two-component regulator propeller domain-containing protein [Myxococcota bacterium]
MIFTLDTWGVDDGLPQGSVTAVAQDTDGFLWLTTFGGLARFDGVRFVVTDRSTDARLPADRLTALVTDRDGRPIVGTEFGHVARVGGDRTETLLAAGEGGGIVWDLAAKGDQLWAATSEGLLYRVGEAPWTRWPVELGARAVANNGGGVWAAVDGAVLHSYDGKIDRVALPGEAPVLDVVVEPGRARIWVATDEGLFVGDASGLVPVPGPATSWARLAVDAAGRLWMGTRAELLLLGDADDVRAAALEGREATPVEAWRTGVPVRALTVDRSGSLWVGTDGAGLWRLREEPFARYGAEVGLPEPAVRVVEATGAEVVVGAGCDGPRALRGGRFEPLDGTEGVGCVSALLRTRAGELWIGHDALLRRLGGPDVELPSRVRALAEARDGAIWAGTEGHGVFTVRDGVATPVPGATTGVVKRVVEAPDGAMWVTLASGVLVVAGGVAEALTGLPDAPVRDVLVEPDGSAWLGTYGAGLVRWADGRATRITRAEGLPENVASVLIPDAHGRLWVNGNRGVYSVELAELREVAEGARPRVRARRYPTGEGNGGMAPAASIGRDGRLWFATLDGVVAIDPGEPVTPTEAPTVAIEALEIDGRAVALEGAVAPPGNRDVVVRFTASTLADPLATEFRVRLDPLEAGWRDVGSERAVRYASLPPGEYAFEVQARSPEGAWSEGAAAARFALRPRLTEVPAFRVGGVALALGIVLGGAGLRVRSVQRHNAALRAEIERRERAEGRLAEAERLEALGRLAGGVAHDFNNLLMAVGANAKELRRRAGDDPVAIEAADDLVEVAKRGAELTGHLLAFGRRQVLAPEVVDVSALVLRAQPLLRPLVRDDLVFETRLAPAGTWACVDPGGLELTFVNLVLHAARGEPRRVALTVAPLRDADARARWPRLPAGGDWVLVAVEDDGPAIAPERLARIFEPFVATRAGEEAGMGLASVHGFVTQSSGFVFARSDDGGTRLDVLLPAVAAPAPASAPEPLVSPIHRGDTRVRVVLCDDDAPVRRAMERVLLAGGYRVRVAEGGRSALALLRDEPADVLVTDVVMPEMGGPELARQARAMQPTLKVVYVSGHTGDVLPADLDGVVLAKPFEGEVLLATLGRMTGA